MRAFDALPRPLRLWLADASMPWSPESAQRLWRKARTDGLSVEDSLNTLSKAEARMLASDRFSVQANTKSQA